MTKLNKKEEVGGGLFVATCLAGCVVIFMFLYPPVNYFLGKWDYYWQNKEPEQEEIHFVTQAEEERRARRDAAYQSCEESAQIFFGTSFTTSFASSTSGDEWINQWMTYDCHGYEWQKLPNLIN